MHEYLDEIFLVLIPAFCNRNPDVDLLQNGSSANCTRKAFVLVKR